MPWVCANGAPIRVINLQGFVDPRGLGGDAVAAYSPVGWLVGEYVGYRLGASGCFYGCFW